MSKELFLEALIKAAGIYDDPVGHADRVGFRKDMQGINKGILPKSTPQVGAFDTRYSRLSALKKGGRQPVVASSFSGKTRKWGIGRALGK